MLNIIYYHSSYIYSFEKQKQGDASHLLWVIQIIMLFVADDFFSILL